MDDDQIVEMVAETLAVIGIIAILVTAVKVLPNRVAGFVLGMFAGGILAM